MPSPGCPTWVEADALRSLWCVSSEVRERCTVPVRAGDCVDCRCHLRFLSVSGCVYVERVMEGLNLLCATVSSQVREKAGFAALRQSRGELSGNSGFYRGLGQRNIGRGVTNT